MNLGIYMNFVVLVLYMAAYHGNDTSDKIGSCEI